MRHHGTNGKNDGNMEGIPGGSFCCGMLRSGKHGKGKPHKWSFIYIAGKMVHVLLVGPTCWFAGSTPSIQFCVRFVCGNACRKASDLRLCEEFVLESEVGFILPILHIPPQSSWILLYYFLFAIALQQDSFTFLPFITFLCFPNARSTKACPSECPFAAELADPTKCRGENVGGLIVTHHSLSLSLSEFV